MANNYKELSKLMLDAAGVPGVISDISGESALVDGKWYAVIPGIAINDHIVILNSRIVKKTATAPIVDFEV